ncbi:MAG: SAM-dependent methyltransferase, partial [Dehalococcoidia bacterium]
MPIVGEEPHATVGTSPQSWNQLFAGVTRSPTLQRIMRVAFGADEPYGAEPFSFVTRAELEHITRGLAVGPGDVCVDLGCGRGGPALWVARTTGAHLLGVDVSSVAVGQATARARVLHLDDRAAFH